MIRRAAVVAAAAGAFVATFALVRVWTGPAPAPASAPRRAPPAATAPVHAVGAAGPDRRNALVALPPLRVRTRAPTPYEAALVDSRHELAAMKMALQAQVVADQHQTADCFEGQSLIGRLSLDVSLQVEATAGHAVASALRVAQVDDGMPIERATARCIEAALAGPYETAPTDSRIFPEFVGAMPLKLSWDFGAE